MPVYIVRCGNAPVVKIGKAINIRSRIAEFQTANPEVLTLVREIEGYGEEERAFHRRYSQHRLRGEWFRFCETMLTFDPVALPPEPAPEDAQQTAGTEIQRLLDDMGWSRGYVANRVGVSGSTMRYWADGKNSRGNPAPAPDWLRQYLQECLDGVNGTPPPVLD